MRCPNCSNEVNIFTDTCPCCGLVLPSNFYANSMPNNKDSIFDSYTSSGTKTNFTKNSASRERRNSTNSNQRHKSGLGNNDIRTRSNTHRSSSPEFQDGYTYPKNKSTYNRMSYSKSRKKTFSLKNAILDFTDQELIIALLVVITLMEFLQVILYVFL